MKKTVSVWAKKNFIHWFVESHAEMNPKAKQLMLQIVGSEELLMNLQIVFDGSLLRPLLVIATEETGMPPFTLKSAEGIVTDFASIQAYLSVITDAPFYVTLYFRDRANCEPYFAVSEEGHLSAPAQSRQMLVDFELSLWMEEFKRDKQRTDLLTAIDGALDTGDKRKFRRLIKKLKAL